jgi:uncharacterized membrane protein YfcA
VADPTGTDRLRGSLTHKLAVGAAGGALPGLLGIGTGGIMVPAFAFIMKAPIKTAIGCSLTCFCLNALVSAAFKCSQGYVALAVAAPACIGTLVGAQLGAIINRKAPSAGLKITFGVVFVCVSLKFILTFLGARA